MYEEGVEPVLAADGATAPRLATGDIAAVVLHKGLPDADGRDVCRALRANDVLAPVIFLTSRHQFADRELTARLRASVKRTAPAPAIAAGDLILDASATTSPCTAPPSPCRPVALSPTEFRLLATLLAAGGHIVRCRGAMRPVHGRRLPRAG
ncbi:hypothetical protein AB0N07_07380 [Streptomyces sp. NPDC051172]|uniref:response regulator transcription factor n=1 Tax=Streptomyces sp. NPDC051172 TaxID=3155796 RepID=UPI003425B537